MSGATHLITYFSTRLRNGEEERLVTVERWAAASKTYWVRVYDSLAAVPEDEPLETTYCEMSADASQAYRDTVRDLTARGYVVIDQGP